MPLPKDANTNGRDTQIQSASDQKPTSRPPGELTPLVTKPHFRQLGNINLNDPALAHLPPHQIYGKAFLTRPPGPYAFVITTSAKSDGTGTPDASRLNGGNTPGPETPPPAVNITAPKALQGVTCKVLNQGFKLYPVHLAPRSVPSPGVEGTKKVVPVIQDGDQAVPRQEPSGTEHTVPVAPPDGNVPGLRTVCVSSYVTPAENLQLKAAAKRLHQRKGELLRRAYFESTVTIIVPEANEEKWQDLARVCANLNQIASKLNLKDKNVDEGDGDVRPILRELGEKVHHLRADLRGNSVNKSVKT